MIRGLNHINHPSDTLNPDRTPEQPPIVVEAIPTRREARDIGRQTLQAKRNLEKINRINETRSRRINSAIDELDRVTQKLMEANARAAQSIYMANTPAGRENKRR